MKIVNGFAKPSILDVWQGSEYASAYKWREKELEFVENPKDTELQETKWNKNWKGSYKKSIIKKYFCEISIIILTW